MFQQDFEFCISRNFMIFRPSRPPVLPNISKTPVAFFIKFGRYIDHVTAMWLLPAGGATYVVRLFTSKNGLFHLPSDKAVNKNTLAFKSYTRIP